MGSISFTGHRKLTKNMLILIGTTTSASNLSLTAYLPLNTVPKLQKKRPRFLLVALHRFLYKTLYNFWGQFKQYNCFALLYFLLQSVKFGVS